MYFGKIRPRLLLRSEAISLNASMEIRIFKEMAPQVWDAFCTASSDAWFRHTRSFINFAQTLGNGAENYSFAVENKGQLVAVAPLIAQKIGDTSHKEFAMGGTPTPYPALARGAVDRESVLQQIFREIEKIAGKHDIAYMRSFVDPLSEPVLGRAVSANPLQEYGFSDTSISTVSIDLAQSEAGILDGVASRRRRYILSAERRGEYLVEFHDGKIATEDTFAEFEKLYFEAAGKFVGTRERWQGTLSMLMRGEALLVLVRDCVTKAVIAGHYLHVYKHRAYDALSAIRPSHQEKQDLGSFMQWKTMRYLKQRSFTRYEVGWILPTTISETVYSKKELAISHFKLLFGGEQLPIFRGEKYFDESYKLERKRANEQALRERERASA